MFPGELWYKNRIYNWIIFGYLYYQQNEIFVRNILIYILNSKLLFTFILQACYTNVHVYSDLLQIHWNNHMIVVMAVKWTCDT